MKKKKKTAEEIIPQGIRYVRFGDKIVITIPRICYEIILHRGNENFEICLPEFDFTKQPPPPLTK